jgi:hypothetical protein
VGYQTVLRLFLDYATDRRYGWPAECVERFGQAQAQLLHEWNTVAHVGEYEGDPRRRPLTYDEVQALFDAADGLIDDIRARGRKGALAAQRDAALLKTVYASGCAVLRRGGWTFRTWVATRRRPGSAGSAAPMSGSARRRGAVRRSGARC